MPETPKTNLGQLTVTPVIDPQALREFAAQLDATLAGVARSLQASVKRGAEVHEAGALFALFRQMRSTTDTKLYTELQARWLAAIEGYETAYLADLITFGEHLADTARPVWGKRTR